MRNKVDWVLRQPGVKLKQFLIQQINNYQSKGGGKQNFRVDCNFTPSCSEYAKQALLCYSTFRGGWMAFKRISRCKNRDLPEKIYDPLP